MLRITFRVLIAVVGLSLAAQQAQAFGHRHGSSGGSWGSSGGSWGSSGGSWGSSGGSWGSCGSSGGWYYYGSSGSSGGSWGSSGGSWGSSGSSGGWHHHHGSCGSSGGHNYAPAPAQGAAPQDGTAPKPPAAEQPGPSDPAAGYHPTYGPMRNSALLSVKVPADAKVFVNDRETTSTGSDREFISRDLQTGARYNYEVRAEFTRDGKIVTENKTIQLTSGQTAGLDFTQGDVNVQTAAKTDARTTLIVKLPADAKLFLAGHETHATGTVREFSTTKLSNGSEWNTYAIRAVVERDGQQQVREENVSLKAGESREVTISFDALASEKVANETASR